MGGEAPPPPSPRVIVVPRRAAAAAAGYSFRLPRRHGRRRKVHVVRLGGGGGGAGGGRRLLGHGHGRHGRGIRLRRWLRRAVWRLAELCAVALSGAHGHPGAGAGAGHPCAAAHPPWTGVEPCFAAPFVPVALMKRAAGAQG